MMDFKAFSKEQMHLMSAEDKARHAGYADLVAKTFRRLIGAAVFLLLLVVVLQAVIGTAQAGGGGGMTGGATEFTQIKNNVEMALQTVESKLQTFEQIEQTYLSRLQQLKQSIGEYTAPFQQTMATWQRVRDVQTRLGNLQYNLGNMKDMMDARYREFAASPLTFLEWQARELRYIQRNDATARAKLEANRQVIESTGDSLTALKRAAEGLDASTGTHQATRMLGPMLTTIGGDINKLITITAISNENAAEQKHVEAAKEEAKLADYAKWKAEQDKINAAQKAEFERMQQGWKQYRGGAR